jgi:hypothetical protein
MRHAVPGPQPKLPNDLKPCELPRSTGYSDISSKFLQHLRRKLFQLHPNCVQRHARSSAKTAQRFETVRAAEIDPTCTASSIMEVSSAVSKVEETCAKMSVDCNGRNSQCSRCGTDVGEKQAQALCSAK